MIRGLLDRLVLLGGVLLGGCLPGFIVQYRQRVGGRLDQVIADLAPFREIAARFHGGDMDALVRHHLASSDPTFHAEGAAIQSMLDAQLRLQGMADGLAGSVWQQLLYLVPHYDREIGAATWGDYIPAFAFDTGSLVIAMVIGVLLWLLFLGAWRGIAALTDALRAARRRARRAQAAGQR